MRMSLRHVCRRGVFRERRVKIGEVNNLAATRDATTFQRITPVRDSLSQPGMEQG